jgi:DNA primase
MSSSVEQIKERLTIEDIVGSYIKLERAGNSLKARCPFHNEKTPSFFVSPDRGSYYCFGCGAKGDIFTFVQEFESIDFVGALKILADRAGVQLETFSAKKDDTKERLYTLLEFATLFLEKNLAGEEIPLAYLTKRGLKEGTIKDWRIGYVRDEWRSISDHLKSKGFTDSEIERAGITKTEGNSTYDRFRGRIMFPIFDSAGRVIAYSGRILVDDGKSAKYLNSPQTEIFDKSKVLYGYDRAKQSIRKADYSILVEGQMDLLMSHQAGFTNTVASSGTALTISHLNLLKRISNKIIMSFDSDNAGAKAAERGWALALSVGMDVKIAEVPKGFDPADLILKDKEDFKTVLKNSVHIIDFIFSRILQEHTDQRKIGLEINSKVLPYVYLLESNIEKSHYITKISEKTGISEDALRDDLKKVKLDEELQPKAEEVRTIVEEAGIDILKKGSLERSLAGMVAGEIKGIDAKVLSQKIKDILGSNRYQKFEGELEKLRGELAFENEAYYGTFDDTKMQKEIDYSLLHLREDVFKRELNDLLLELKKAEHAKDTDKINALSIRLKEIVTKLSDIKQDKNKFL